LLYRTIGGTLRNDFLGNLTKSVEALLNDVLASEGHGLFKRAPRVVTGVPFSPTSNDYHLYFCGHELLERDQGTFRCEDPSGASLVYRNPNRIRVNYALLASQGTLAARFEAWDKLMAFFFDSPAIDPFLPEGLRSVPGLCDRLAQEKALLTMQAFGSGTVALTGNEPVQLSLQYSALYHSGAVLNREALVKQRVIEYRNRERSAP
jgi:hypothetical protein